ncbi:MAG: endo-1,4-beta-xylanase [Hyphomicrobiaceae bacterium]|nr:endo-1,4-beta-xylanase [Hyphomicrobiaceae bacterium]
MGWGPAGQISRRAALLGGAASLAAATATGRHAVSASLRSEPGAAARLGLGDIAARNGIVLGASFAVHELDTPYGAHYAAAYLADVRSVTSELSFKMSVLRPTAGVINLDPADRLVDFAARNRLKLRAHTLVWNDDLPDWIHRLGPGEVELLLEAHTTTLMERYRGKVWAWDVVNEPIAPWDHLPGNLRKGPFLTALGEGYIARAFHLARSLDPTALLVINEAQTETDDENGRVFRTSFLALLKRLRAKGVPIDAVGLQAHLRSDRRYDFAVFKGFLDEIAALGYAIHITELDVNDSAFPADEKRRDAAVADLYRRFLTVVLAHRAVTAVTFWQLADHTSWLTYMARNESPNSRRRPRPLLLDDAFKRKPAWFAVESALKEMPPR